MEKRIKVFRVVMYLILGYILIHLVVITLFDPFNLSSEIEKRHEISKELEYYHRGNIYDCQGNLLVTTQYYYQLDFDKRIIKKNLGKNNTKQHHEVYRLVSHAFAEAAGRDEEQVFRWLTNENYDSIFLGDKLVISAINNTRTKIDSLLAEADHLPISKRNVQEALLAKRTSEKRIYPYNALAPRLLGLAIADTSIVTSPDEKGSKGKKFRHLKGRCGMERTFDKYLTGENGWKEIIYDALGDKVLKPSLKFRNPKHGEDIFLTINVRYQEILEEKLHEGLLKYQAKNAMGVIMDVHTGEILALAGEGKNDEFLEAATLRTYTNLPVSFNLEPGSTMKPITALIALEKSLYKQDELIDCNPLVLPYATETRTIKDHINMGKKTLEGIIVHSSNPGISRVAMRVGSDDLEDYYNEIGLGRETLSNIYGETRGVFRSQANWSEYSLCSVAFGQEMSVNMLHLAVIYAAFANLGNILQPQILAYSRDQNGNIHNMLEPKIINSISQPAHLKTLQKYLRNVVSEGTATATNLDFIEISGKTGTSEIITVDSNNKVETRHNSLFAGYLPSNDPRIVIVVAFDRCVEDKNKFYFASKSAVPTFKEVVKNILLLKDCDLVTSTTSYKENIAILPNMVGMKKREAEKILKDMDIDYSFVNSQKNGIISDQYPPANIKFSKRQPVKLALALPGQIITDKNLMPDFHGMTLRKALALARSRFIKLTASGNGIVVGQSIKPMTEISLEDGCHITLR